MKFEWAIGMLSTVVCSIAAERSPLWVCTSVASACTVTVSVVPPTALGEGAIETRISLAALKDVVRRMSAMPGQRIIVLVSSGFHAPEEHLAIGEIIDDAIHANVPINSLDVRGVQPDSSFDVTRSRPSSGLKQQYEQNAADTQSGVMAGMSYGTGGAFFQKNNDLNEGMRQLVTVPEYYYLLSFSPQNLKLDGSFHTLKVTVDRSRVLNIQARNGYYAPKQLSDPEQTAKQEIEMALFSRDELTELPLEFHSEIAKSGTGAKMSVECRLDARHIPFRKVGGRNSDTITVAVAVFDRDGVIVKGIKKSVDLRLTDETLVKLLAEGSLSLMMDFAVAPGTYRVRAIVRDSEGVLTSAVTNEVRMQ